MTFKPVFQNQNLKVDNLGYVSQIGGSTIGKVDNFGSFQSFNSGMGNGRIDNMNRLQEFGGPDYGKVSGFDSYKDRYDNKYGDQDNYRDKFYQKPEPFFPYKSSKYDDYDDYDDYPPYKKFRY